MAILSKSRTKYTKDKNELQKSNSQRIWQPDVLQVVAHAGGIEGPQNVWGTLTKLWQLNRNAIEVSFCLMKKRTYIEQVGS